MYFCIIIKTVLFAVLKLSWHSISFSFLWLWLIFDSLPENVGCDQYQRGRGKSVIDIFMEKTAISTLYAWAGLSGHEVWELASSFPFFLVPPLHSSTAIKIQSACRGKKKRGKENKSNSFLASSQPALIYLSKKRDGIYGADSEMLYEVVKISTRIWIYIGLNLNASSAAYELCDIG